MLNNKILTFNIKLRRRTLLWVQEIGGETYCLANIGPQNFLFN